MSAVAGVASDRFGLRKVAFAGGFLAFVGMLSSAFVQDLMLLYLTYGVCIGVGFAFPFTLSVVILGHYFKKRLGLVNGIATFGSWDGGSETKRQDAHKFLNVKIWRNRGYLAWAAGTSTAYLGYLVPFFHMVKHSDDLFPESNSSLLPLSTAIAIGVSRLGFGLLTDVRCLNPVHMQQAALLTLAWVGSVATGLTFLISAVAGVASDRFGLRKVGFAGGFLAFIGMLSSAFVPDLMLLYLTYGVCIGVGSAFPFTLAVVKHSSDLFPESDANLLPLSSAVAIGVARLLFALVADVHCLNPVHMQQAALLTLGITTICIPTAHSFAGLVVISIVVGACDGLFFFLNGPIVFRLVGERDASQALGFFLSTISVPITVGAPLAVSSKMTTRRNRFKGIQQAHKYSRMEAWVGSVMTGLVFLMSAVAGVASDRFGLRKVAFTGGFLAFIGMLSSAFVQDLMLLYLTYGVCIGVGFGLSFVLSIAILGHYFKKRLGLANGLVKHSQDIFPASNGNLLPLFTSVAMGVSRLGFGLLADVRCLNPVHIQQAALLTLGLLYDHLGSYTVAFHAAGVAPIAGALIMLLIPRQVRI
nr:hypothetical protein BaRGS_018149 [Batillaria attramentaria]